MSKQSRQKIGFMIYLPPEMLAEIERRVEHGKRSQWVVEACRQRLARREPQEDTPEFLALVKAEMEKSEFSPGAPASFRDMADKTRLDRERGTKGQGE